MASRLGALARFLLLVFAVAAQPAAASDCSGGGARPPRTAIPLFYVTDRNDLGTGGALHWGKASDSQRHYGSVETSILRSCATLPAVAAPWWQPFAGPADRPRAYFLVHRDHPYPGAAAMAAAIDDFLATLGGQRDVILFVHGYNQSFSEAGRDAAQLAMDLPFRGASVFYSWPSQDSLFHYDWDATRSLRSEPYVRELIRDIIDRVHPDHFHIVGHSLGNRVMISALLDLARERSDLSRHITSVTLLSPDLDEIAFARATEGGLGRLSDRITLFTNRRDRALAVSRHHNGGMPLGRWLGAPYVAPGLTTIDITPFSHSLTRHADFEHQAAIMREIAAGMAGLPLAARFCLAPVQGPTGLYFRIDAARPNCPAAGAYSL
jgi:esterase/lipase superfamily enzyme